MLYKSTVEKLTSSPIERCSQDMTFKAFRLNILLLLSSESNQKVYRKTAPFDISVFALSHAKEDADGRSDKKSTQRRKDGAYFCCAYILRIFRWSEKVRFLIGDAL